jgi:predicted Zn-dependent peptidase
MFVISGALDPRRAAEALAEVRRGIDALHRDADVRRHFAAARRAVRSRLTANISVGQIADTLAGLIATGRRPEDMAALGEAVARLGPDDIVALAQAELVPARATVVVRGPAAVVAALTWDGRKPTMQP